MSTSTNKKVLVARFDKGPVEGFAQLPDALAQGGLDVLSPASTLTRVPLAEIRLVAFIRDFGAGETWSRHRSFLNRPKAPGLWVRVKFRDGQTLEGVMPNNLLADPAGFSLVPPDPTFQNQRIFVPREAATAVEVLGVIGSPLRRKPKPATDEQQLEMFG